MLKCVGVSPLNRIQMIIHDANAPSLENGRALDHSQSYALLPSFSRHIWVSPKLSELDALSAVLRFVSALEASPPFPLPPAPAPAAPPFSSPSSLIGGGGSWYIHGRSSLHPDIVSKHHSVKPGHERGKPTAQQDSDSQTAAPSPCPRPACCPASAAPPRPRPR